MDLLSDEVASFARAYQEARHERNESYDGLFLPLELLVDRQTGRANLSVSFSGTAGSDVYVTQRVDLIRAVKVTTRWLIVPWTVAKVLTPSEFEAAFSGLYESLSVDDELYWVIKGENGKRLKQVIRSLELDETFRQKYEHSYLPEPA